MLKNSFNPQEMIKKAHALADLSRATQLQKNSNYSFHQVEKLLLNAAKADVFDSKLELANFYKQHRMFKEALYWFDKKAFYGLDHNLLIEIASWYEEGIGTEVNYDKAAELYLRIAHSNNEALIRLLSLHKDKKTSYFGTIPQRNNYEYWQNLLHLRMKQKYWNINNTKSRLENYYGSFFISTWVH